jgi:hypothetical protein
MNLDEVVREIMRSYAGFLAHKDVFHSYSRALHNSPLNQTRSPLPSARRSGHHSQFASDLRDPLSNHVRIKMLLLPYSRRGASMEPVACRRWRQLKAKHLPRQED